MRLPCQATIDLTALRANYALARDLAGGRQVIAVVKADAYGHDAASVAKCLWEEGCRRLAVLTVPEAQALREAGIAAEVLVLAGARSPQEASTAVSLDLTPVVHAPEGARQLEVAALAAGARLRVHAEIDTGMHRMGVPSHAALTFMQGLEASEHLVLEGVYTHLAQADEADLQPSLDQLERFRVVLGEARACGIEPEVIHAANSAALMCGKPISEALPEATAVRPGLMLYGVRPAPHLEGELSPVMTLHASVLAVRDVAPGASVGYAASWTAPAAGARVATLSVGYADGVPWTAANRGRVWLGGAPRPIVGRVSMDSIAVDLGDDRGVCVGDEAVLFGALEAGTETPSLLSVEDAAEAAGTLHYELLVRVGARVPRVIVD